MIGDVNPFVYSHPLSPDDIIDREGETRALLANAVGGHFVRLYAPRKYGKTSLLQRALRDGEREEGLVPVLVDLYRVVSLADVTVRLERAYARHLKGAIRARVDQFLQRTGIGLSLGVTGISARIQLDPKADPLPALHALLDLPLRLEQSGGYRALIAFDEFQDVQKVPDLDGIQLERSAHPRRGRAHVHPIPHRTRPHHQPQPCARSERCGGEVRLRRVPQFAGDHPLPAEIVAMLRQALGKPAAAFGYPIRARHSE